MNLNLLKSATALVILAFAPSCSDESLSGSSQGGTGTGGTTTSHGGTGGGATGGGGGTGGVPAEPVAPTVISTIPQAGAVDVALNGSITAVFSEPMNPSTLDAATFTLGFGAGDVPVEGTVVAGSEEAVFWPAAHLENSGVYTATITTGAHSAFGLPLKTNHAWTFTTGNALAPGQPVNLGTAGDYVILAKSAVSTVPTSAITGDVALSPAAATFLTGFSLTMDAGNAFSKSPQVTGNLFAADYAPPTPSKLTTAVLDMELAFTDAAARAPDVTELGAGDIGGMTLAPGVYKWGTGLMIPTNVILQGSGTDVWIFQVAQGLLLAGGTNVILSGGAQPKNVFWQVAGLVKLGTTSHFEGVVLSQTSITLQTGASVTGRLLAQTAVDLDSSTVTEPAK